MHVTSGATYVASYFSPDGSYSADTGFFDAAFDAAPLHASGGSNGVYAYTAAGALPTTTTSANTNYGADVVFVRSDQTPPTVTTVAPVDGADAVDPGTRVTASFDEPIDASTVVGATFQLRDGAGALVPADVTYDAATRTAILRPRAPLAGFVTYRATLKGGAAGIGDAADNALAGDRTWSFTTGLSLIGTAPGGEVTSSSSGSGARAPEPAAAGRSPPPDSVRTSP